MASQWQTELSRRERQIMEVVYRLERASVADVREHLPDPPTYSSVRATMNILEQKGHLQHEKEGRRYIYSPTLPRPKASRSALRDLLRTFFDGSVERAVAALLDVSGDDLTDEELDRLRELIEETREEEDR